MADNLEREIGYAKGMFYSTGISSAIIPHSGYSYAENLDIRKDNALIKRNGFNIYTDATGLGDTAIQYLNTFKVTEDEKYITAGEGGNVFVLDGTWVSVKDGYSSDKMRGMSWLYKHYIVQESRIPINISIPETPTTGGSSPYPYFYCMTLAGDGHYYIDAYNVNTGEYCFNFAFFYQDTSNYSKPISLCYLNNYIYCLYISYRTSKTPEFRIIKFDMNLNLKINILVGSMSGTGIQNSKIATDGTYIYMFSIVDKIFKYDDNLNLILTQNDFGTRTIAPDAMSANASNIYYRNFTGDADNIIHTYATSLAAAATITLTDCASEIKDIYVNSTYLFVTIDDNELVKYTIGATDARIADYDYSASITEIISDNISITGKYTNTFYKINMDTLIPYNTFDTTMGTTYKTPTMGGVTSWSYDSGRFYVHELSAPHGMITPSNNGAGNITTGTYQYAHAFRYPATQEDGGITDFYTAISLPSTAIVITTGASNILLTNIATVETDYWNGIRCAGEEQFENVVFRRYQSDDAWSEWRTVYTLPQASDTLTVAIDSISTTAWLSATAYNTSPDYMPKFKYIISYNNRLYGAGDTNYKSIIFYSNYGVFDDWLDNYNALQYVQLDQQQSITGFYVFASRLYCFTRDSIWRLAGSSVDSGFEKICEVGCISSDTIAEYKGSGNMYQDEYNGYLIFLSERGVIKMSPRGDYQIISESISNIEFDDTAMAAIYDEKYHITTADGNVAIFNLQNNSWVGIYSSATSAIDGQYITSFENATGAVTLYTGDSSGNIWFQDTTSTDNTTAITASFISRSIECGNSITKKRYSQVYLIGCGVSTMYTTVNGIDSATRGIAFSATDEKARYRPDHAWGADIKFTLNNISSDFVMRGDEIMYYEMPTKP